MSECMVCHGKRLRAEPVDKVFNTDGRYVLVTGMPLTVCQDCGERSFRGGLETGRHPRHGRRHHYLGRRDPAPGVRGPVRPRIRRCRTPQVGFLVSQSSPDNDPKQEM